MTSDKAPQDFEEQRLIFPRYHLPGCQQHALRPQNAEFLPEPRAFRTAALYGLYVDADTRQEICVAGRELFLGAHIVLAIN